MRRFSFYLLGAFLGLALGGVSLNADAPQESPAPVQNQEQVQNQNQQNQAEELAQKPEEPKSEAPKPEENKAEESKEQPQNTEECKPEASKPEEPKAVESKEPPQNPEAGKPEENVKAPGTIEVKSKPFEMNVEAPGIVWSRRSEVFTIQAKVWETFRIETVVPHGTRVKKGDLIVKFEREPYQRELDLRKLDSELADLAHQKSVLQRKVADVTFEITKKQIERKKDDRNFKYSHNKKYDLEITTNATALKLDRAVQSYRNQKAELDQLSKMYEADDLCDATEEIVLQRQKLAVQSAEHEMNLARAQNVWSNKMLLPRFEEELDDEYRKDMATIEADIASLELTRRTIELERRKVDHLHQTALKKFQDFQDDAKWLEIHATEDCLVLYGTMENGDWTNYSKAAATLKPGKTVGNGASLFTLVDPASLYVKLAIPESHFSRASVNQKGYFVMNTYPDVEIPVTVTELEQLVSGSTFEGKALLDAPANVTIHPGLRGKAVIAAVRKSNAILIPETALKRDENLKRYVFVTDADGKNPVRRYVKTGFKQGTNVEIRDGLDVGMKIVEKADEVE